MSPKKIACSQCDREDQSLLEIKACFEQVESAGGFGTVFDRAAKVLDGTTHSIRCGTRLRKEERKSHGIGDILD
jgi:hypothetical protein